MPRKIQAEIALHEFSVRYRAGLAKRQKLSAELMQGIRDVVRDQYEREREGKTWPIEAPKIEAPSIESPSIQEPKIEGAKIEAPRIEEPKIKGPKIEPPRNQQRQIEGPEPEM